MGAHEYYSSVINKAFDEDGSYGVQCVDGFKHFCRTVVGYNISYRSICSPSGLAYSIWDNFEKLGLDKYFDKVPANAMQDGDWAIWSKCKACPSSHIAMFRKDNNNCTTGIFLGQNQTRNRAYTQVNIAYAGLRGALRPKCYHKSQPVPAKPVKKDTRNFVNLPPNIDQWRFYSLNDTPVKANSKGYLKPKKFGGLSYYVYEYKDNGTTAVINTVDFGKVKIYLKGTCANISIGSYKYKNGNH